MAIYHIYQIECEGCRIADFYGMPNLRSTKREAVAYWRRQGWLVERQVTTCPACYDRADRELREAEIIGPDAVKKAGR